MELYSRSLANIYVLLIQHTCIYGAWGVVFLCCFLFFYSFCFQFEVFLGIRLCQLHTVVYPADCFSRPWLMDFLTMQVES